MRGMEREEEEEVEETEDLWNKWEEEEVWASGEGWFSGRAARMPKERGEVAGGGDGEGGRGEEEEEEEEKSLLKRTASSERSSPREELGFWRGEMRRKRSPEETVALRWRKRFESGRSIGLERIEEKRR